MKFSRIWTMFFPVITIILVVWVFWFGGVDKHYVDVYFNDECKIVTLDGGVIETLFVFPGDFVIWNNPNEFTIKLNLPPSWFEEDYVEIPSDQRVTLEVIRTTPGLEGFSIEGDCPGAVPKVRIGEGP